LRYFIVDTVNKTLKQISCGNPIPFTENLDIANRKCNEYKDEGLDVEVMIFKNIQEANKFLDSEHEEDYSILNHTICY